MQTLKIGQSVEFWNDFNNRWETGWVLKSLTDAKATIANKDFTADVARELIRTAIDWSWPATQNSFMFFDGPFTITSTSWSKDYLLEWKIK